MSVGAFTVTGLPGEREGDCPLPTPTASSGPPRGGQLAGDLVGTLQQGIVDVLGACDLCLDEGQVLGVGGGSSVEELKVDLLISHGTAVLLTEP